MMAESRSRPRGSVIVAASARRAGSATKRPNKVAAKSPAGTGASPASKATTPGAGSSYHHGALHDALLAAAGRILERDGVAGLTLRAAAREAGVSHAAPTHHFGDLAGLVSELAASGFRRFAAALSAAAQGAAPDQRLDAMGRAYVAFATAHPTLFTLMFRSERLDPSRPALKTAMEAAGAVLAGAVEAHRPKNETPSALAMVAGPVRAWALVHGFAVLLLDRRLDHIVAQLPPGATAATLLDEVLKLPAGH